MSMTRTEAMKKIAEAAEGESLIGFGAKLKAIFGEKSHRFNEGAGFPAHHVVKSPDGGKDIMVVNVKYVDGPEHVVGDMAIG